jgi:hypothetical protein
MSPAHLGSGTEFALKASASNPSFPSEPPEAANQAKPEAAEGEAKPLAGAEAAEGRTRRLEGLARRMEATGLGCPADALREALGTCPPDERRLLKELLSTTGADGRLHPRWKPFASATGRWGCGPWVFSLPHHLRQHVWAEFGWQYVVAEWVSPEVPALAALSNAPLLRMAAGTQAPYEGLFFFIFGRKPADEEVTATRTCLEAAQRGITAPPRGVPMELGRRLMRVLSETLAPWLTQVRSTPRATCPASGRQFSTSNLGHAVTSLCQSLVAWHMDSVLLTLEDPLADTQARLVAMWHEGVVVEAEYGSTAGDVLHAALAAPLTLPNGTAVRFPVQLDWRDNLGGTP